MQGGGGEHGWGRGGVKVLQGERGRGGETGMRNEVERGVEWEEIG